MGGGPKVIGAYSEFRWGKMHENPGRVRILEEWMKSYRPEELFDPDGRLRPDLAELPSRERRMSAQPACQWWHATARSRIAGFSRLPGRRDKSGGCRCRVDASHGRVPARHTEAQLDLDHRNFRLFSPDENNSNHCRDALEVTDRVWTAERYPLTTTLHPKAGVAEMLSEHQCQGWLEGYLLTGRHGFFSCYEAFIALA
jgi:xylulose-5-phosphate/fructose-6-phosphate phosphoketolase